MKKQRKYYTPEEKVAILRRHLLEQVPIVSERFRGTDEVNYFRMAENNRPIAKGQCGSEEFENVILFSFELTLSGG